MGYFDEFARYILKLFTENRPQFIVVCAADILLALIISRMFNKRISNRAAEALGQRNIETSFFDRCSGWVSQAMEDCGKRIGHDGIYKKTVDKLKKAGFKGKYPVAIYLMVRYVGSPLAFAAAFMLNYPDLIRPLASVVLINSVMEMVISSRKKKTNLRLQKSIYKVYKYLHNQVSSGVKPTDAIRSVYEVVDDRELREMFIRLAARYELTLDIDEALEEFRSCFDAHEAETLCIALKQGVDTGDNRELLERQEDIMFKKYFNYIQAETDSCRNRSVVAAAVFVAIVAVMIIVPMLAEMSRAAGKIFIN